MAAPKIYNTGTTPITGGLTGSELVDVDNGGPQITTVTTAQIAALASLATSTQTITALNTVGAGTITAAGIVGRIVQRGGAQTATPFIDTTDTAAAIILALPSGAPVGTTFDLTYENTTNAQATLANGANVTLVGNLVVPALTWAQYLVKVLTATTVSITFVKAGSLVTLPYSLVVTGTNSLNATIALSGLTGAQICSLILGIGSAGSAKLPPAVQIIGATPNAAAGLNYNLTLINQAALSSIQLTGLTGTIISGSANIKHGMARSYNVSVDSPGSLTLTGLTNPTI